MVDAARLLDEPSYFVRHYCDLSNDDPDVPNDIFDYQEEFMDADTTRKIFVSGRQVGKSRTAAWIALWKASTFPNTEVLITAKAQRQSMELFNQVKKEIHWSEYTEDQWGVSSNNRTEINFYNNSRILCLPVGIDGSNIRGYSSDLIIVDEAAFIPDEIFQEVISPMLAVGRNSFVLLSTPFGKKGFLWHRWDEATKNDDVTNDPSTEWYPVHVPTMANPLVTEDFIEESRQNLTHTQFRQEIMGEFVESSDSFFERDELLNCAVNEPVKQESNTTFMGVDLGGAGDDESVYICLDDTGNIFHIESKDGVPLTDAMGRIRELDTFYDFDKVIVDSTGLGEGVVDQVKEDLGRKVEGFKFTNEKKQSLYNTLKSSFQKGKLKYYYIPGKNEMSGNKLFNQCHELTHDYTSTGKLRIKHPKNGHDDYPDALALAEWARSRRSFARPDSQSMKPFNLGSLR